MMLNILLIGTVGAALAFAGESGLGAKWPYNPLHRPVIISVQSPLSSHEVTLALMDAEGSLLCEPIEVRPGSVDLAELIPDIWRLRRASYVQMIVGGNPTGSALVLQPMLSRLIPVTEDAVSPAGVHYTKIVDWRNQRHPEQAAADAGDETDEGDDRLLSGLRIYRERDVLLRTSAGDIHLAMRPDCAPNTVWNFLTLCEGGFYRDLPFHRIVPMTRDGEPFVIQAGDPTPTGGGGPGYWLPMEKSDLPHDFGVISMARDSDPDSAGSQFFICLSREGTARLDGHYCAFGYAVAGDEVILAIASVELADIAAGRAMEPPIIEAAELVPAPPREPGRGRPDRPVQQHEPQPETQPSRAPR